ncbi:hypothetical protein KIK84_15800 [Curvibacter sp. CHRR-16]|uniref:DUF6492 family protein n=1 Tax=Curvibacter sp. CHRR-16 TaxID=2835872 RepID=UPI001BDAD498|nr:DUF6492 family protein [Curvibacter sp. CHRR-16]MBT0571781.1 hypothetical protein [Curvibacter sp. CHRR-16]
MRPFVLYCKSYSTDVKRVARLAKSIAQFNVDSIPFYVSVPQADMTLFEKYLAGHDVHIISDESIIECNPAIDPKKLTQIPGSLSQQVVKSEFWRLNISIAYLCLDSDCIFIRPFRQDEFITPEGTPYTIIDEAHDILYPALSQRKNSIIENFRRESLDVQKEFGRNGKHYSFGPNSPIWDRRVWLSLAENYINPRKISFLDLIIKSGNEQRWYGEALLKYKAIDLLPSQPIFKMYHYAWQMKFDKRIHINEDALKIIYCGVVYQSSWEREMDWPSEGGSSLSKLGRRIRRALGRT